ncbi:MAG: hypothetical protein K1X78_09145 [Verrucomicrobiaceae bacterium]|nr:hypothetical protein [Verrucomicrobiaceae bacterium]
MRRTPTIQAWLLAAMLVCSARAEDAPAVDPDLPQPFDETQTQALISQSPFTRTVNLKDSLRLTGIAYVGGKPVATMLNKETRQSFTVSDEPNAQGIWLTEAAPSAELDESMVTILVGDETVTMHYGDEQLSPGAAKKGAPTSHLAGSKSKSSSSGHVPGLDGGGEHVKASSLLGSEAKALYETLSSSMRSRFKDIIHSRVEKHPDMTPDQLSAYAEKLVAGLKKAEDKSAAGGSSEKVKKSGSKPSKLR